MTYFILSRLWSFEVFFFLIFFRNWLILPMFSDLYVQNCSIFYFPTNVYKFVSLLILAIFYFSVKENILAKQFAKQFAEQFC